jgi:very-short-patch-repair endonuclease
MSLGSGEILPSPLRRIARSQDGVVSREQLRAYDVNPNRVRNQQMAGRWQTVGRRVVVLHNGPITWNQLCWIGLLHVGPAGALGSFTALQLAGLERWARDEVHVSVGKGRSAAAIPGIRITESRTFTEADTRIADGRRICTVPRAAIEAASGLPSARSAMGLVAAVVQQRRASALQLQMALNEAGNVRHRGALLQAIADISGGADAVSEMDFLALCRAAGLPHPRLQVRHREQGGRSRYIDAEFTLPNGRTLSVEIDGVGHIDPDRWWADHERQNELMIGGARILRFPAPVLRLQPDWVVDQVRRALDALSRES